MFSITTDARVYENAVPKDRNLPPLMLPEGSDVPLIGGERTPDVVVRSRYVPGAERVLVAAMSAFDAVCALGGEDLRVARADVDDLGIGVEDIAELTSYTEPTPVLGDAVHALLKALGDFTHACRVKTQGRINSAYAVTRTWNDLQTHEQDVLLRAADPAVRMLWDKEIRREWAEILWTAPVPLVLNTLDIQLLKGQPNLNAFYCGEMLFMRAHRPELLLGDLWAAGLVDIDGREGDRFAHADAALQEAFEMSGEFGERWEAYQDDMTYEEWLRAEAAADAHRLR